MKVIKFICILFALIILWFLAVDMSMFVEDCEDCSYGKDIFAFRICTLPIYQIVHTYESPKAYFAEKLGVPCLHKRVNRWHRQKWWGLLFCYRPCHRSIYRLSSSDNEKEGYKRFIDENIKRLLEANPALPAEFKQRVLVDHDMDYWKEIQKKIFPNDTLEEGENGLK